MLVQCLKRFLVSSGIWLVLVCIVPSLVAQSPEPPYRVPVVGEDAVVHAGPGSTLYGTDRLPPGTLVDVYRHDPGGWMAIRPPEGSFSLVQLDEVDLLPNGLARIKANETVAWVGTRLTAVEDPTWQVRLDKGELVEVLGVVDREKFELGDGEPDWVQIMPPKGEFRWIAGDQLDLRQKRPIKGAGPVPQFVDNDHGDPNRTIKVGCC